MKTIFYTFLLMFSMAGFAKEYQYDCDELGQLKHALSSVKDPMKLNSQTSPGKDAIEYLTAFFKKALMMKSELEAAKFIASINTCFAQELSPSDYEKALSRADEIKNKHKLEPMPEKGSFSIVELTCAGFSVKEILAFMQTRAAVGAAAGTATTATVGSTALAIVSAGIAGLVLGETIKIVDSQSGHYGYKYIGKPISNKVLEPLVFKAMGTPSTEKQLESQARLLSVELLLTFKENKFNKSKT